MNEICHVDLCCGCEACANRCPKQCIEFSFDAEGFFVPRIHEDQCVDCGLCRQVCPMLNSSRFKKEPVGVFASFALDEKIRCASSSGGIFSLLADKIITDGGIVNGTVFDEEFICRHNLTDNQNELEKFRGSKYVQSRTGFIYREIKGILKSGKKVLFTGTPCQVAGLYSYLGKEYETLFTCDLVCHGVPAPKFLQKYIKDISAKYSSSKIKNIGFRKLNGWGKQTTIYYEDNIQLVSGEDDYYSTAFFDRKVQRYCCYNCPYATHFRIGDITLGDFWGLGLYKRFKEKMDKGVSLVLINSPKGQQLLDAIKTEIYLEKRPWSEAIRQNHSLQHPIIMYINRHSFYSDYYHLSKKKFMREHYQLKNQNILMKNLFLPYRMLRKALRFFIRQVNHTQWG